MKNLLKEAITILNYNLRDNCNSYELNEDGSYSKREKGRIKSLIYLKNFIY